MRNAWSAAVTRRRFLLGFSSALACTAGNVALPGFFLEDAATSAEPERKPVPWLSVTAPEGCSRIEHDDAQQLWQVLIGRPDSTGGWPFWFGLSAEWAGFSAVEVRQSYVAAVISQNLGLGNVSHQVMQIPGAEQAYKTVLSRGQEYAKEYVAFLTVQRGQGVGVVGAGCSVREHMADFWAVVSSVAVQ